MGPDAAQLRVVRVLRAVARHAAAAALHVAAPDSAQPHGAPVPEPGAERQEPQVTRIERALLASRPPASPDVRREELSVEDSGDR